MANSKSNSDRYRYALIDTAPGADGYWSDTVSPSKVNASALFFSYRGTGYATVTLQFKTAETGSAWQDYETDCTLEQGRRYMIRDYATGVKWRAGVKVGNLISGSIRIGLDW